MQDVQSVQRYRKNAKDHTDSLIVHATCGSAKYAVMSRAIRNSTVEPVEKTAVGGVLADMNVRHVKDIQHGVRRVRSCASAKLIKIILEFKNEMYLRQCLKYR